MKIALSQINFHIGNISSNANKIIEAIKKAELESVDLIVFSELSICGYSPLDMLERKDFIEKCYIELSRIAKCCRNIAAIVGAPMINKNKKGKKLFNSAVFCYNGEIEKVFNKTLLPTYDIFDEYRYFESNDEFSLLEYKNKKIAVTICEDLWDEQKKNTDFDKEMLYRNSPMNVLSKYLPDFVINISGSPYSFDQAETRKEILIKNSKKYKIPIIYVNQIGANTELIFDGGSFVLNRNAEIVAQCKYFQEDFVIVDVDLIDKIKEIKSEKICKYANINNALVLGIKDYFEKSGFSKAVLGLSGGIDSAITLALAVQALGHKNVEVLLMPTKYSSLHSISDSVDMAERCNINYHIIEIEDLRLQFDQTLNNLFLGTNPDVTEENIQARIRGSVLMAFSNKFGHILLNTSNKSEAAVGYTTLYGDMNGAIAVIGDLYKSDVYNLAVYINENIAPIIPENIITKLPSAELRFDQKDSDSLPNYDVLDPILFEYIEKKKSKAEIIEMGFDNIVVQKVISLVENSEYKRFQAPPVLRISSKAFGFGRRLPIVAVY